MKGVLYYFSGTGNTKWIADRFKEYFILHKVHLDLVNIEKVQAVELRCYDFIIIGFPVYAELAPKIIYDFINRLPEAKKVLKSMIYTTQGIKTAAAASIISKKIEKKGYRIVVQCNIQMPNNYYFAVGKELTMDEQDKMLIYSQNKVKKIVNSFMENNKMKESATFLRIGLGKAAGKLLKNMLPKLSKNITATDECTRCGLCLRNCPKSNITFENGHAIFHSKCMMCLRCIYICPKNVIRYKGKKIKQIQKERIQCLNLSK